MLGLRKWVLPRCSGCKEWVLRSHVCVVSGKERRKSVTEIDGWIERPAGSGESEFDRYVFFSLKDAMNSWAFARILLVHGHLRCGSGVC